jgi:hypothetical protein
MPEEPRGVSTADGERLAWQGSLAAKGGELEVQSMSRRGQCGDNALTESFFSTMKRETRISRLILDDCQAVELALVDWIETWYNPT